MNGERMPESVIDELRDLQQSVHHRCALADRLDGMGWYLACPGCGYVMTLDQPDFRVGWPGHCERTMELRR